MKLAVIGDELAQDCRVVAETTAELGFDAVEIRSMEGTPPHLLTDDQLVRARAILDEHGLANAGFAPPAFKVALPETDDDLRAAADLLVDGCRRAVLLGAPHVRIFSFYRDGDPDPVAPPAWPPAFWTGCGYPSRSSWRTAPGPTPRRCGT